MATTSASLLDRLRRPDAADADWRRLNDLYTPLILDWLARTPGVGADAADLAQQVLLVVVRKLPGFVRQHDGSFRGWLRTVTINQVRNWRRAQRRRPDTPTDPTEGFLAQLEDPASELTRQWDQDHDRHVFDRLLAAVRPDFAPATWDAFRLVAIDGLSAAEAATANGLTTNAVLLAKSRVMRRLRQEAGGLID